MVSSTLVETENVFLRVYPPHLRDLNNYGFLKTCAAVCPGCLFLTAEGDCKKRNPKFRAGTMFRSIRLGMFCPDYRQNYAMLLQHAIDAQSWTTK